MSHKLTTQDFVCKSRSIHGDKYDYSITNYIDSTTKVNIICPIHGEYEQLPSSHVRGSGCPQCKRIILRDKNGSKNASRGKHLFKMSQGVFIERAQHKHNNRYDYTLVEYTNYYTKISIICSVHGPFLQTPDTHLRGAGCPSCAHTAKHSIKAIHWLTQISLEHNIYIQHADNEGEFLIPGTKLKADGYCKETNTIYEFHGDKWHGNPSIYPPSSFCHPYDSNITAGELYKKTCERDNIILSLGYNLITMWESEANTSLR